MKSERKNNYFTFITNEEEETEELGSKVSSYLKRGDVLAFTGELGAGKTHFIKGICAGLGIKGNISSPTFTLINEYKEGLLPVYHFDFYRISEEDLHDLGYWEYIEGSGICLIEWADRAESLLPPGTIRIRLEYLEDTSMENFTKRKVTIEGIDMVM